MADKIATREAYGNALAELGEKEIILYQAELQLLAAHIEQLQKLIVGQKMPIPFQNSDVASSGCPLRLDMLCALQPHRGGKLFDIGYRCV